MEEIRQHIEALIFCSEQAITSTEIALCLSSVFETPITRAEIEEEVRGIEQIYAQTNNFYEIAQIAGGYQFLTRKEFAPAIALLHQQKNKKQLSPAAMETLAIIVYKQPVTKTEIEQIRGVNCDYTIQRLLEKDLIQIDGKSDSVGRPLIYSTSRAFMDHFKLNSLDQLPQLKDLPSS